jgi:hypothetical protein
VNPELSDDIVTFELGERILVVTLDNPPVNALGLIDRIGQTDDVLADIREFAQEDPLFWHPSPLIVDLVERGADFASINQSA